MVVITLAYRGLGLESTKAVVAKGATVVMACRNTAKAEKAKADVLKQVPSAKLDLMTLTILALPQSKHLHMRLKDTTPSPILLTWIGDELSSEQP